MSRKHTLMDGRNTQSMASSNHRSDTSLPRAVATATATKLCLEPSTYAPSLYLPNRLILLMECIALAPVPVRKVSNQDVSAADRATAPVHPEFNRSRERVISDASECHLCAPVRPSSDLQQGRVYTENIYADDDRHHLDPKRRWWRR